MLTMWIIIGIALWVICGALAYGITFAYFQKEWPNLAEDEYLKDKLFSIGIALGGPVTLGVSYFLSGYVKHGLKWK